MTTDSTARSDSALGGWRPIETCLVDEATRIFAFNGDRVGEAVPHFSCHEAADWAYAFEEWRWANDSCDCCWYRMSPQPVLWQPLPEPPTPKDNSHD